MKVKKQLIKLVIFVVVTVFLTGVLATTIGNISFADSTSYQARFSDVTGLVEGDGVRIAGVEVGQVQAIQIVDRSVALVTFDVRAHPLRKSIKAQIRYRNLIGQRYISLTEGAGSNQALPAGGVIPLSQTSPALDLTTLFNGFRPLFKALSPKETNQLAMDIIQTLQGEGGTVNSLLASTASLTSSLADKDQVIGDVVNQLNAVLATVDARDENFSNLIVQLQQFTTGLAQDREAIGSSLENIANVTGATADLVQAIRPDLKTDIVELGKASAALATKDTDTVTPYAADDLAGVLQRLPTKLNLLIGTASYGSWFNFFLCRTSGTINAPVVGNVNLPDVPNSAARCQS